MEPSESDPVRMRPFVVSYSTPSGMKPPRSATTMAGGRSSVGMDASASGIEASGSGEGGSGSAPHPANMAAATAVTSTWLRIAETPQVLLSVENSPEQRWRTLSPSPVRLQLPVNVWHAALSLSRSIPGSLAGVSLGAWGRPLRAPGLRGMSKGSLEYSPLGCHTRRLVRQFCPPATVLIQENMRPFGTTKALFMTVWRPSTRSAENSCGIRQG